MLGTMWYTCVTDVIDAKSYQLGRHNDEGGLIVTIEIFERQKMFN